MISKYAVNIFKYGVRISLGYLSGVDARIIYRELKLFLKAFENKNWNKINNDSLLIVVDDKEIYRDRANLKSAHIKTIEDILIYLDITSYKYVIIDNEIIDDISLKLSDVYTLEIYTSWSYLSRGQLKHLGKR